MGGCVNCGKHQQSIGNLAMEPCRFIKWQPSDLRSDPPQDIPAHGQEYDGCINGEDKACTSRDPDRVPKYIEAGEFLVGCLDIPNLMLAGIPTSWKYHIPSDCE